MKIFQGVVSSQESLAIISLWPLKILLGQQVAKAWGKLPLRGIVVLSTGRDARELDDDWPTGLQYTTNLSRCGRVWEWIVLSRLWLLSKESSPRTNSALELRARLSPWDTRLLVSRMWLPLNTAVGLR